MISSLVLSPTASAFLSSGAWVQPQPGLTCRIFKVSVPVEYSQKMWLILAFCGTKPKSNSVSGIVSCGAATTGTGTGSLLVVIKFKTGNEALGGSNEVDADDFGDSSSKTVHATTATATAKRPQIDQIA